MQSLVQFSLFDLLFMSVLINSVFICELLSFGANEQMSEGFTFFRHLMFFCFLLLTTIGEKRAGLEAQFQYSFRERCFRVLELDVCIIWQFCLPCGNCNFPLTVIAVVTEESTVHGLHSRPCVCVYVCVCVDAHVSWKVEKATYVIVELHQPPAPCTWPLVLCNNVDFSEHVICPEKTI